MSMTMAVAREPKKITGKKVLIWMIAFFGVIIAVNSVFMFFAINTWPGLTTEDSYKKGVNFNQTLEAAARQSALGWLSKVEIGDGTDTDKAVIIRMTGQANTPLSGLVVTASVERAVGTHNTQIISMSETSPGVYSGIFKAPMQGRWIAEIRAAGPNNTSYRMKHQVMITP
ncbi:FixH family protein [Rhodospirillales bacterium]|nr:FixH family protein [Rhodospirillales bacterium]